MPAPGGRWRIIDRRPRQVNPAHGHEGRATEQGGGPAGTCASLLSGPDSGAPGVARGYLAAAFSFFFFFFSLIESFGWLSLFCGFS